MCIRDSYGAMYRRTEGEIVRCANHSGGFYCTVTVFFDIAGGKTLKACKVNVTGDGTKPLTIITLASNVQMGSRVIVTLAETSFLNAEEEEETAKKTMVEGVMSDGMFCDSHMLGWSGGGSGVAAQVPDSYDIGSAPPSSKP